MKTIMNDVDGDDAVTRKHLDRHPDIKPDSFC